MQMHIVNFESLAKTAGRKAVLEIVEAGLSAIQPGEILANWSLPPDDYTKIFLLGFGKGSATVAKIIEDKLGARLNGGWVIDVAPAEFKKMKFTLGTHPLPSQTNVDFARQLPKFTKQDLVVVAICGGGSALFTDPVIPVEELIEINRQLLKSGATILQINTVRKHLDRVKGGGLATRLYPARVLALIFSDVPGNDTSVIASGPTVEDKTSIDDAWWVAQRYGLPVKKEELVETTDNQKYFAKVQNVVVLSNLTALAAMKKKAEELGFNAEIVSDQVEGEAREVGRKLVAAPFNVSGKKVWLWGGETTVTAKGKGQGGRNQELVMGALPHLSNGMTICAVDSDGWDNSAVAGAIGDKVELDPTAFLENNDSYNYFQKTGDFIETGRLPSNVADLIVVLKDD